ncbi:MAG: nucleoside triphosphate pyrophosphohydrolase family protein [Alkalibacterium sp.]|nr:nucleoside triphosphate pyrophosphohydrolase family protein [Alkalibacterium sp.]
MNELKVGDRVKLVKSIAYPPFEVGKTGRVTFIDKERVNPVIVKFDDGFQFGFGVNEITKVEEETNLNELTLKQYQNEADRTANNQVTQKEALTNYALGITGEAGEVADMVKKYVFHDHELDRDETIKELGDVMWYVANIATCLNVTLEEVAQRNVDKLKERYPDGFDTEKSKNRKEYEEGATNAESE